MFFSTNVVVQHELTQVRRSSALSRSVLQLLSKFQLVLVMLQSPVQVLWVIIYIS